METKIIILILFVVFNIIYCGLVIFQSKFCGTAIDNINYIMTNDGEKYNNYNSSKCKTYKIVGGIFCLIAFIFCIISIILNLKKY